MNAFLRRVAPGKVAQPIPVGASCLLLLVTCQGASAGDTLQAIEAACVQRIAERPSLTAKIRMQTVRLTGAEVIISDSNGTYEHLLKGDQLLFRVEMKNEVTTRSRGREVRAVQQLLTVCDGRFAFTLTQQGTSKSVVKNLMQPGQSTLADKPFFEGLRRGFEVKVLPDAKLGDEDAWVIEAIPRQLGPGQPAKMVHYILKSSGIRSKSTGHDQMGRRIQLTQLTELSFEATADAKRFRFELPKGVEVLDLTK